VTFVKINIDNQKEIATTYNVSSIPAFIVYRNGQVADRVRGANPRKLQIIIMELSDEANAASATAGEGSGSSSAESAVWRGAPLPRGYTDITRSR
jgi:thioredoxin-like negative regulator of GroEL